MTGMEAKDRIPLLERELRRIENELAVARATRESELLKAGRRFAIMQLRGHGFHLAADWLDGLDGN